MTVRRVLESALGAEHQARAFYKKMVEMSDDGELSELYQELADFEATHVRWIETLLEHFEGEGD